MPGSVLNAAPTTVMPFSLCSAFVQSREWIVEENRYRNGESQRRVDTATSRKSWSMQGLYTPTLLLAMRTFWLARRHEPFYFYDPWETSPIFSHDPTGTATTGRYVVRFEGEWAQTSLLPRSDVPLRMVESA